MATAIPLEPPELERVLAKLAKHAPLTGRERALVQRALDEAPRADTDDPAPYLNVERMRAMGIPEERIAIMCDASMTEAERMRRLGFDDETGSVVARTPEEIEGALGAIACAPST